MTYVSADDRYEHLRSATGVLRPHPRPEAA